MYKFVTFLYYITLLEDLRERVSDAIKLPPDFSTVHVRTQVAQQIFEIAQQQSKICEDLVRDQHMQQQGWAAVIANLEDITLDLMKNSEIYLKTFCNFLEEYESHKLLLTRLVIIKNYFNAFRDICYNYGNFLYKGRVK